MKKSKPQVLRQLAGDIEIELAKLSKLATQLQRTQQILQQENDYTELFYKSLAFDLQSFYTGCERIFSLIAKELNGGIPKGEAWHRQLLERMGAVAEERGVVISAETARALDEFLKFRHVVRSIYGFDIDTERIDKLLSLHPSAWDLFESDIKEFVNWLRDLSIAIE